MTILEKSVIAQLINNIDYVIEILHKLPLVNLAIHDTYAQFDEYGERHRACAVYFNNLSFQNFRDNTNGNIFDLISKCTNKPKDEIVNEIYLNLFYSDKFDVNISYSDINETNSVFEFTLPDEYPKDALDNCQDYISDLFLKDNVWISTQKHFKIKYDFSWGRVIIPVYQHGGLVGAVARINNKKIEENEQKYLPKLKYKKGQVLFGLDEFKKLITKTRKVILVESEKSVMKMWQYRTKIPFLAIGNSHVTRWHIEMLNSLGITDVTLALDKGIDNPNVLLNNLDKLIRYSNANIHFVDTDNCELLEDKESIADRLPKEIVSILKKYTIKNINKNYINSKKQEIMYS